MLLDSHSSKFLAEAICKLFFIYDFMLLNGLNSVKGMWCNFHPLLLLKIKLRSICMCAIEQVV